MLRLWALLALVAHGLLAFQWAFASWAPWIVPDRVTQVFVALVGVVNHGGVLWATKHQNLPVARVLAMAFAVPYLILTIAMFYVAASVTLGMLKINEPRFQQHLDSTERIRAEGKAWTP